MFADARRIPLLIALLLAADCALALIPVVDFAVGHPWPRRDRRDPRAPARRARWVLLIVGFIVMFTGALVVELVANLVSADKHSGAFLAQVVIEESLEMLGVTLIAWSACSLLDAYGLDISVHPAAEASASVQSVGS